MRLIDLNPEWLSSGGSGVTETATGKPIPLRERIGISFDCPCGCPSPVSVRFSNPLDGLGPAGGGNGWARTGDTFETLTLSPSIQREYPTRCWHGFVTNGEVTSV